MAVSILLNLSTSDDSSMMRELRAAGVLRSFGEGGGVLPRRDSSSLEKGEGGGREGEREGGWEEYG